MEVRDITPSGSFTLQAESQTTGCVDYRDVTPAAPVAILSDRNVAANNDPPLMCSPTSVGKSNTSENIVFVTPTFEGITSINIMGDCVTGTCDCKHFVGSKPAQLLPCQAARFLFGPESLDSLSDSDKLFLWGGLMNGFKIVDTDCPASYSCKNYDSITDDTYREEMSSLLTQELESHKVPVATTPPRCIHSLGAVEKSDGRLRPITDCSRPDGTSINNYMTSTFKSFTYNSVDTAVQVLHKDDFMSVVDISAAYRSVNVHCDDVVSKAYLGIW